MVPVTDLVTFLRARLDEDERLARGADDGVIAWIGGERHYADAEPGSCRFIRHQLPSLVLREVEAKRAVLAEALDYEAGIDGEWGCCHSADAIAAGECPERSVNGIPLLRLLAFPYSSHPDYDPSWRPASPGGKP